MTTAQDVIAKTLSKMTGVKSYQLVTDISNTYKVLSDLDGRTDTTEWKGTRLINIPDQAMAINMTIAEIYAGSNLNATLDMYFQDGEEYLKTNGFPWTKNKLDNSLWNHEIQMPYLTELLKTATRIEALENTKFDNIECYVVTVVPAVQAMIDLVVSQEQPFGTQIDVMFGGAIPVVRPDAYQSGSMKLLIRQDNYLPLKVEFTADFQGNVGGGPITIIPYSPTTNPVRSSFRGLLTFTNYNQNISIQAPQEALDATTH
ncbi:MAG: hypothetical protein PHE50_03425 [Dehalococcoidales bacterium]|nr:hypothetical protein [Dehalococcoidales bacterium]